MHVLVILYGAPNTEGASMQFTIEGRDGHQSDSWLPRVVINNYRGTFDPNDNDAVVRLIDL